VSRHPRDERGLTLIEMLVSLTILGIIMVVLTTAVIAGLKSTQSADVKFTESNTAQFTSMYFTHDVQGAESVSINDTAASCGGSATLKLISTAADRIVAYATAGSPLQLVRRVCSPASTSPLTTILAPSLNASTDVTASALPASCTTACTQVTLNVTQPGATGVVGGLNFTVSATPRP
jgi:prepilin-type N-terminal cleavage/methylation domain-containing protein